MSLFRWLHILLFVALTASALDLEQLKQDSSVARSDGSDIGIMIMGTIANKKAPEKNVALVKEKGKIRAIKINMAILDGYTVTTVQEKYIVISNKEKRHLVFQNKFANEFETKSKPKNSNDLLFAEDGFERTSSSVRMTAAYRDNLVKKDLSNVLMQATAIPHYEDGTVVGFKLLQIDEGSIYQKSGFIDHDVITEINGTKLNSASGAIKLLNSLKGAEQINVEYMRFGEMKRMDISVR